MPKGNGNHEETQAEVNMPVQALTEQTLAVDLARAEIDQAIATAHRYPRMLDTVIKKIETLACYNEQAAENCIYSLPRAGKAIIGPSVSFANIVAQAWGNCTDGARITYIDRKEKVVIAEGGFHDLETNRKTVLPVQRRIVDKAGRIFNDDMILVTAMAATSIARRNAILNAIPRAIWFPIYERCLQIVRGDVETFSERKDKALKAFAQFGVKPEQVYMVLGLKGEADLTLEHLPTLRGMYSALRNQESTVEEMFDPRRMTGTAFETVNNPLGDEEIVDKDTGEIKTAPKRERGRPRKVVGKSESAPEVTSPHPVGESQTAPDTTSPQNPDDYRHHLANWLMQTNDAAEIEARWRAERNMRGNAGVIEDAFASAQALKDERISQLSET
jgi:hypothetical protein